MSKIIGTFYAIRVKGTLKYLPQIEGRGNTYAEPCAGPQPRLFHTDRAAKIALTAWLKGHACVVHDIDYGDFGERYHVQSGVEYKPVAARRREDMEIVPVILTAAA